MDNPDKHAFRDLAPDIAGRSKEAKQDKESIRKNDSEFWSLCLGEYGGRYELSRPQKEGDKGTLWDIKELSLYELSTEERYLVSQIDKLIKAKAETESSAPVVAVDFGGMFGISFLRLAAAKKSEIESSRLVLVVTNLKFDIDSGLKMLEQADTDLLLSLADMSLNPADLRKLIVDNKNLVHYETADAVELRGKKIALPNGQSLQLSGSIDLLCEQSALMHGIKNDVDLPLLGKALGKDGMMMLSETAPHPRQTESAEHFEIREKANKLGYTNLQKLGLQRVSVKLAVGGMPDYKLVVFAKNPEIVLEGI